MIVRLIVLLKENGIMLIALRTNRISYARILNY